MSAKRANVRVALDTNFDYIITGDEDLLELKQLQDVQIVTPAQFLSQAAEG